MRISFILKQNLAFSRRCLRRLSGAGILNQDRKEVKAMKRFMIPRVAHCGSGH